jgi:hypothetical protein
MMIKAKARNIPAPKMNKLEARYAAWLESLKKGGGIRDWAYQAITLKLADDTRYTPDFLVIADGVELHETKGFMRDDARVKLRVAATQFPWFTFKLVSEKGGQYQFDIHEIPII